MQTSRDQFVAIPFAKRVFDAVISFLLIVLTSPLFLVFFLCIWIEHCIRFRPWDPLLYAEIRFSEGKPFTLFKFNIFKNEILEAMRARGEFIETKRLERNGSILVVGWVLKQIYLDELPQLFNVLAGDMSIVGPRPVNALVRTYLCDKGVCDKEYIRAGMTGLYQAEHKIAHGGRSQEELDHVYVQYVRTNPWHRVLWLDVVTIFKTVKVLLLAKGI